MSVEADEQAEFVLVLDFAFDFSAGRMAAGEQVIEEFNKGDVVKAVVLDVDVEKERISLGIKQL
ncbi:S1 RNA-binding domain-containing protein, partial [Rhizobium leguminosarum]|uniref:S1 RNA-binding domain-containing protein n=1 Tax=Rhizobium leguminosarum TaxID=384 RepID=UPI003F9AFECA